MGTCRKRFLDTHSTQSMPVQEMQDDAAVNVNTTKEDHPTSHPSRRIWGEHTTEDIREKIDAIYDEIVVWRRNIFMLPSGAAGKQFVSETTKWIEYWNQDSLDFKNIALKVVMIMPALLLQKPTFKSTAKEHSKCLSRRLKQWESGDFDGLISECRTIQGKLRANSKPFNQEHLAKTFAKLIFEGKVKAAMRLLDEQGSTGVLPLSQSTINELKRKHPEANEADPSVLIDGQMPYVDPVMFCNITESTILKSALRTKGSSGPSGLDTDGWRRILVSKNFGNVGKDLRCALATFARKVSTIEIEVKVEDERSYTSLDACLHRMSLDSPR